MRGEIVIYDAAAGTGKISGQDGNRYTFTKADMMPGVEPKLHLQVDFDAIDGTAKEIARLKGVAPVVVEQRPGDKDKVAAGVLALLLGGLGIHCFYLGQPVRGIVYILFCWTFIPAVVSIIEAILLFVMSTKDFDRRYNGVSSTDANGTPRPPVKRGPMSKQDKIMIGGLVGLLIILIGFYFVYDMRILDRIKSEAPAPSVTLGAIHEQDGVKYSLTKPERPGDKWVGNTYLLVFSRTKDIKAGKYLVTIKSIDYEGAGAYFLTTEPFVTSPQPISKIYLDWLDPQKSVKRFGKRIIRDYAQATKD